MRKCRLFVFLLAVCLTVVPAWSQKQKAPSRQNLKIYGIMSYDTDRDVNTYGVYVYKPVAPVTRKQVVPIRAISASGGAIYDSGKLYTYNCDIQYGYVNSSSYTVYDASTGEVISTTSMGYDLTTAYHNMATATAKEPLTGKVYASSYRYDESTKVLQCVLSTWDLAGNKKDEIADLSAPMRVMAADSKGNLYGITMTLSDGSGTGGNFVKINKTTGELTVLGNTGISANKYYQSAVIDTSTDTFYWFCVDDDQNANLYTVSLTDGKPTLIGALPKGDQVQGAYILAPEANDKAPSAAEDLSLSSEGESFTSTMAFTMPTTTYDGSELNGTLNYSILNGTTELAKGTAEAGAKVSQQLTMTTAGEYTLTVVLSNDAGESPKDSVKAYIGLDTPVAPSDVKAVKGDEGITVSWTAPSIGTHGKTIDASKLTYIVKRQPDNAVVAENASATTLVDAVSSETLRAVHYEVAAVNSGFTSAEASSNNVLVGESVPLPYSQDFTDENSLELFTVINANNDTQEWYYYRGTVRYRSSYSKAADDWLIMPPVKLSAGKTYTLSYQANGSSSRYTQKVAVTMGDNATAEAQTTTLKDASYAGSTVTEEKITIQPAADGIYYIGFHNVSEKSQGILTIDNLKLVEGSGEPDYSQNDVPKAVTDVKVVDNEDGTVDISWSAVSPVGEHDGKVDLENVTYTIKDGDGNVIAKDLTVTSYKATGLNATTPQKAMTFTITATTSAGTSVATSTSVILVGPSQKAPFSESFANAAYENTPWVNETLTGKSYNGKWAPRTDADKDENGGGADFQGFLEESSSRLESPKINIDELATPVLSFWLKIPTGGATVDVQVRPVGGDWITLQTIQDVTEWTKYSFDLTQYKGKSLQIGFVGHCTEAYNFAYVDQISVANSTDGIDIQRYDDTQKSRVYTIDGKLASENAHGVLIIRQPDGKAKKVVKP